MGLNIMFDFRELCFKKTMRSAICCLKVQRYLIKFLTLKIVLVITQLQNGSPENIKCGLGFSSFMDHKKQSLRFHSSNIACQQY